MPRVLEGLKPERVFYYFEELSKIPRCSKEEEKISDYLAGVGREFSFETIQDDALNIIIKKPGTSGYENSPTVVLQGHMDMVCEKDELSEYDFSKDPINLIIDDNYVTADGTTLGADNGVAVAMCLAVLESDDIAHPPSEVLITADEELEMTGAHNLDPTNISGRMLINIDSEEEGIALVNCSEEKEMKLPLQ